MTPGAISSASTPGPGASETASVSVSGVTTLNGTVVGHWPAKSSSVPAGQTVTLDMQSAAPIASNYAGDTLQVAFTGTY